MEEEQQSDPEELEAAAKERYSKGAKGAIGLKTAVVLYCLLLAGAAYLLKGNPRLAMLAVICAAAREDRYSLLS